LKKLEIGNEMGGEILRSWENGITKIYNYIGLEIIK